MLDTRYFSYFQTNIDYKYPQPMFKNGFKAVLTSTHNLYFIAKTKKLMYYAYPCYNIVKVVYIFLIFALGHISWLLIHNVYPRSMFERKEEEKKKKTKKKTNKKKTDHYFSYANNHFYSRDILQYIFHGRVIVIVQSVYLPSIGCTVRSMLDMVGNPNPEDSVSCDIT